MHFLLLMESVESTLSLGLLIDYPKRVYERVENHFIMNRYRISYQIIIVRYHEDLSYFYDQSIL